MQIGEVLRYDHTLGIAPRPLADALAGVDAHGVVRARGAEVSLPVGALGPRGLGERVAMRVGPVEAAEIRAVALAGARDEERHVGSPAFLRRLLALGFLLRVHRQRQARRDEKRRRHHGGQLHKTSSGMGWSRSLPHPGQHTKPDRYSGKLAPACTEQ
jgi:hypothetical protein